MDWFVDCKFVVDGSGRGGQVTGPAPYGGDGGNVGAV